MGVPEVVGSDVPKFGNDVQRVSKCIPRWGLTPKHFLMGFKIKLWTMHVRMGVPETIGFDVPNLIKDVPNLMKDVPHFVKDVPRVPKCVPRWGSASNHFLMGF